MKTFIATAAIALSLSAPAFAQVADARAHFAAGNDSPLESRTTVTSVGDPATAHANLGRAYHLATTVCCHSLPLATHPP